jgi:hypothetical protein
MGWLFQSIPATIVEVIESLGVTTCGQLAHNEHLDHKLDVIFRIED